MLDAAETLETEGAILGDVLALDALETAGKAAVELKLGPGALGDELALTEADADGEGMTELELGMTVEALLD